MDRFSVRFVADNDEKRAKGLMHAEPLATDEVALFVFGHSDYHPFWNKNVSFPLSLAFLNDSGVVVDIVDMEAESERAVTPNAPARFVVEASRGAFGRAGVRVGDVLSYEAGGVNVVRTGGPRR